MAELTTNVVDSTRNGMATDMDALRVISTNLANISTPGYKREAFANQLSALEASSLLDSTREARDEPGLSDARSPMALAARVDQSAGALKVTGNPLDIALEGDGYFVIQDKDSVAYTRNGSFSVDASGKIVDAKGNAVLGAGGPIVPLDAHPAIEQDGRVLVRGQVIGQLRVAKPAVGSQLVRTESGYFTIKGGITDSTDVRVRQGHLEMSNVQPATEMTHLMELMRHLEAQQKVYRVQDEMLSDAIRTIGNF